jgi:hypothetical protein
VANHNKKFQKSYRGLNPGKIPLALLCISYHLNGESKDKIQKEYGCLLPGNKNK